MYEVERINRIEHNSPQTRNIIYTTVIILYFFLIFFLNGRTKKGTLIILPFLINRIF